MKIESTITTNYNNSLPCLEGNGFWLFLQNNHQNRAQFLFSFPRYGSKTELKTEKLDLAPGIDCCQLEQNNTMFLFLQKIQKQIISNIHVRFKYNTKVQNKRLIHSLDQKYPWDQLFFSTVANLKENGKITDCCCFSSMICPKL